jgi:hypothetical protein
MTDKERIAAVEDLMDGFSVERGRFCREAAEKTGTPLSMVQEVIRFLDAQPVEWRQGFLGGVRERQKP